MVTLRLSSPFGYFEGKHRFLPSVILSVLKNETVQLSSPAHVRDFIFISDVIAAYLYFIKGKKFYGEIFNLAGGKQYTLQETIDLLQTIFRQKIKVQWSSYQSPQLEPSFWQANINKAEKRLGWSPQTTFKEGLTKTCRWFKKNMDLYI